MSAVAFPESSLSPCGNCGSEQVRCRERGGGAKQSAQIVCTHCGARGQLCIGADAADQAARD